tara:strand:- start:2888 stop:3040 length:153 start_codon:yes stop_codon:yes gene_type:complete
MKWDFDILARKHKDCITKWDIDGPIEMQLVYDRDGKIKCGCCGLMVKVIE